MSERSKFQLAALACAAMPKITVAGVRAASSANASDAAASIDQAIVLDVTGRQYDVFASSTDAGRTRLSARVKAARTLAEAREPGGLGFSLDQVVAFEDGSGKGPTGLTAVMAINHLDGVARNLDLLTLDDCSAMGTAIGAIHRLPTTMVRAAGYPTFDTARIHAQLSSWIARLRSAGHIPPEITGSWSRIIGTDGLWSFDTCFVHGGFVDGDVLYSGSTITAVTNWQGMQVNDPARDLAWIFAKLDEEHRNAVLAAYGRMMGSRLDDLIMLRANLWLQMEQVGDFIQALNRADNVKIMQFKAQVDRLAHQLGVVTQQSASTVSSSSPSPSSSSSSRRANYAADDVDDRTDDHRPPSTITVGTLLNESERRLAQAHERMQQAVAHNDDVTNDSPVVSDTTGGMDRTGSGHVTAAGAGTTGTGDAVSDSTEDHTPTSTPKASVSAQSWSPSSTPTMAISPTEAQAMFAADTSDDAQSDNDATGDRQPTYRSQPYRDRLHTQSAPHDQDAQTMLIPLLEQEERALRDAQLGLASRTGIVRTVAPGTGTDTPSSAVGSSVSATRSTDGSGDTDDNDDTGETTPKA